MNPARGLMTMRCMLFRNVQVNRDDFNQKDVPLWQVVGPVFPCKAWAGPTAGKHTVTSGEFVMVVDMPGMIVPLGTDIRAGDRTEEIRDRRDGLLFGRMIVDAVFSRLTHLEVRLRSYAELEG